MSRPDPKARLERLRAQQGARREQLEAMKGQLEARRAGLEGARAELDGKREALEARQEGLREKQQQLLAELEERRKQKPKQAEEHDRRWRWLLLLLALLLLLLLVRDCRCSTPEVDEVVPDVPAEPAPVEPAPPPDPEPTDRIDRTDRPEYWSPPPQPVPWLAAFRLQVAARSPRLSECFVGARRPGTFKWTSTVDPVEGRVSDHLLEPMLDSDDLTRQQRTCVVDVLSDPVYRIEGDDRTSPSRISLVIEF